MSDPTPPAVSEAMREAVDAFEEAVRQEVREAGLPYGPTSAVARVVSIRKDYRQRLDAEFARLTGERDEIREAFMRVAEAIGAPASERLDVEVRDRFNLMAGKLDEANAMLARLTQGRDNPPVTNGQRVSFSEFLHANARAEAAEAETARLRAALEDTRAAADELVPVCIAEGDTKGAGALQYVSGFISDRLAALTSQEKTDG